MATVKTFLVAASCGMVLLGAVAAQAKLATNKVPFHRVVSSGISPTGLTTPEPNGTTVGTPLSQRLPLNGLSQSGLGKPSFDARTP